jgi:hypothetical protein
MVLRFSLAREGVREQGAWSSMVLGNGGLLMLFVGLGEEKSPKIQ